MFICGGIGLVPQRSFIKYVLDNRSDYGSVTILHGTKSFDLRLFTAELPDWAKAKDVHFLETVDEGHACWTGHVGVVTTLIPKVDMDLTKAMILICGPPIMYKFVLMALKEHEVPHENIYLTLERKHEVRRRQVRPLPDQRIYVCLDGPVFRYADLASMPEAI